MLSPALASNSVVRRDSSVDARAPPSAPACARAASASARCPSPAASPARAGRCRRSCRRSARAARRPSSRAARRSWRSAAPPRAARCSPARAPSPSPRELRWWCAVVVFMRDNVAVRRVRRCHGFVPDVCRAFPSRCARALTPPRGSPRGGRRRIPADCMKAYTVVGPTNRKPRRLSSFESALDSGVSDGISPRLDEPRRAGRGRVAPHELGEPAGQLERRHRIADRRLDLAAVADDPGVGEQPLDVAARRTRRRARSRTRRTPAGSPRACAGSSATRARPGTPRARAARTARRRRAARGPTRRRGRSGRADRRRTTSSVRCRRGRGRGRASSDSADRSGVGAARLRRLATSRSGRR